MKTLDEALELVMVNVSTREYLETGRGPRQIDDLIGRYHGIIGELMTHPKVRMLLQIMFEASQGDMQSALAGALVNGVIIGIEMEKNNPNG